MLPLARAAHSAASASAFGTLLKLNALGATTFFAGAFATLVFAAGSFAAAFFVTALFFVAVFAFATTAAGAFFATVLLTAVFFAVAVFAADALATAFFAVPASAQTVHAAGESIVSLMWKPDSREILFPYYFSVGGARYPMARAGIGFRRPEASAIAFMVAALKGMMRSPELARCRLNAFTCRPRPAAPVRAL